MNNNYIDRIVMQFYETDMIDLVLVEIFKEITVKRNRSYKAKEILNDYFKTNYPNTYNQCYKKVVENKQNKKHESDITNVTPPKYLASELETPSIEEASNEVTVGVKEEAYDKEIAQIDEAVLEENSKDNENSLFEEPMFNIPKDSEFKDYFKGQVV